MTYRYLLLGLLLSLLSLTTDARTPQPEGPTGAVVCADLADNNLNTLVDATDAVGSINCGAGPAFAAAGGGFAAQAENLLRSGEWEQVTDTTANGSAFVRIAIGGNPFAGEIAQAGLTAGTYYGWALVDIPTSSAAGLWTTIGTTPFKNPPDNRELNTLNSGLPTSGWTWLPLGRAGTLENAKNGLNGTPQTAFVVATGDQLHLVAKAGLRIDCLFFHTSSTAVPQCPSGGGGITEDYLVKEFGANSPNADGISDAYWTQANAIAMTGNTSAVPPTGIWVTRMAWKDSTNRIYFKTGVTLASLAPTTNTGDDGSLVGNRVEMLFRFVNLNKVLDASTYKFSCDNGGFVWDANYPSGVSDKAYDFAGSGRCTAIYSANNLVIEGFIEPTETLVPDTYILFNGLIQEQVTGSSATYQYFRGASLSIANAGIAKISSTIMSTPADTTAPVMGTVSFTNITTGGFSASSTCTETGSPPCQCQAGYSTGTVGAAFVCGASGVSCSSVTVATGGVCNIGLSGLTPATTYNVRMRGIDQAGLSGDSASAAQATSTPAAGTTLYMSPSGSDGSANNCQTEGTPCKTFAYTLKKALKGYTVQLADGVYTDATTGLPNIDCTTGYTNGTAAQPVVLKAKNERAARVNATGVGKNALKLWNCSNWKIEGIVWARTSLSGDDDIIGTTGYNTDIKYSPNTTVRRNIFLAVPGDSDCTSAPLAIRDNSDNALIEENEFYGSLRDHPVVKYNSGGIMRRNYAHDRSSSGKEDNCASGVGHTAYALYPAANWIVENNIADHIWANPTNATGFSCASYTRTSGKHCHDNHWLGNIAYDTLIGMSIHPANPTNESDPGSRPLDNTIDHMLVVGLSTTPGGAAGLQYSANENTLVRRSTIIGAGLGKTALYTKKPSVMPDSAFFSWFGEDILLVNNPGTALGITADVWSLDGLRIFGNGTNYSSAMGGVCGNCTNVVTTNPSIGAKTVWTGLTTGAEIIFAYQNGVLTTTKLWVTTPPSGYSGTSFQRYFRGCGAIVAGLNDTPANSCVGFANRLGVVDATLPGGY